MATRWSCDLRTGKPLLRVLPSGQKNSHSLARCSAGDHGKGFLADPALIEDTGKEAMFAILAMAAKRETFP